MVFFWWSCAAESKGAGTAGAEPGSRKNLARFYARPIPPNQVIFINKM